MNLYSYINTKMGSASTVHYSNGNCYPVCAVPHGMNFFTIQTNGASAIQANGSSRGWFYSPYDKSFEGIRLTHMPSPWIPDYGNVVIFADKGEGKAERYWSGFDNNSAVIEPARISVDLHRDNCKMELSPTNSGAVLSVKLQGAKKGRIVFRAKDIDFTCQDGTLYISVPSKNPTTGAILTERIALRSSKVVVPTLEGDILTMSFDSDSIELRFATSYISNEQAKLNLDREIGCKTIDEIRKLCVDAWEEKLSQITVEDKDEEKKKTFYSCLYRFNLWPRRFYEITEDGKAVHVNTDNGNVAEGYLYTDNGFWDTYRTVYPLYSLIDRTLYAEMAEGFYNYYVDTGWLPKWVCPYNRNCMPGMLVEATLSDAIVKDIVSGDLAERIFAAMLKDGEVDSGVLGEGRVALSQYRKLGYVPYSVKESVNETLDNSYGDFCIAKAAEKLGKYDIAEKYFVYSQNYRNLFDEKTGFIRGKDEYGRFRDEEFDPFSWGRDYTEGSAWQNAFGVYHDIKGLDNLYKGKLSEKIDELMTQPPEYRVGSYGTVIHEMTEMVMCGCGQCAISNQPSFHVPYIYSELDMPEKTSYYVDRLCKLFNSGVEGYPGDEDNGSMSAWYILSAMGLYQMAPSRADFSVSKPIFDEMKVRLSDGGSLHIIKEEYDVKKMKSRVSYEEVMSGGNLWEKVKK